MSSLGRWKKEETPMAGRPSEMTTLAAVESLALPLVQEVVFLADFRCPKCQRRVAEIMAKMNGETQSVVISVLEKTVTLTCTYPTADKSAGRQLSHRSTWNKTSLLLRLFRSSCNHVKRFLIFQQREKFQKFVSFYPQLSKGNQPAVKLGSHQSSLLAEVHCMVMRINLDCNACCRKMRRILLRMKEIETHLIEKQQNKVTVCGRFVPADLAIKIRKKMKRRVEILEIEELDVDNGPVEQMPPVLAQPVY